MKFSGSSVYENKKLAGSGLAPSSAKTVDHRESPREIILLLLNSGTTSPVSPHRAGSPALCSSPGPALGPLQPVHTFCALWGPELGGIFLDIPPEHGGMILSISSLSQK